MIIKKGLEKDVSNVIMNRRSIYIRRTYTLIKLYFPVF